jgi:hypothetical protein
LKATDEWTIFLLLQPKRKLQTLESFKTYQKEVLTVDFSTEFDKLDAFEGVSSDWDYSVKIQDQILAQGKYCRAKLIVFY